jgi:hypothetical protein
MPATTVARPVALAPAWGWRGPGAGRAAHVAAGIEYQGTTSQLCGLYPFVAGSGAPIHGIPIGRHMLWGEVVCLDPLEWLRVGLVTNPGVFVLGQPGAGKSAIAKRLAMGMAATGTRILVLGDTKPDYTPLVTYLGGQVVKVGRGMDRINPLDPGPLAAVLRHAGGLDATQLRLEIRGRRMALLLALCTLIRGRAITNGEEVILGRAVDLLADHHPDPTVPDVVNLIVSGGQAMQDCARARSSGEYRRRVDELIATLALLCDGSLAGVFDRPTSQPIDMSAPAVSLDISRIATADTTLLCAAMLSAWSYGHAIVDASAVLADHHHAPRHQHLAIMDELWRALRGAPGLVEHADALTRLNRAKGMASIMLTHSLADLDALPTADDRAKAQGFVERAAITILAGLPPRELDRVHHITPLTAAERDLVASWAAPDAWLPGLTHPGRGKYLIKTGQRPGLPVSLQLVGDEWALYDTDPKFRPDSAWIERWQAPI